MTTPNIHIPYVPEGTLDPAAGLNLALNFIDAVLQTAVISMGETVPPATGSDGDLYIVGDGATGAWAGQDNNLARYVDDGNFWQFFVAGEEVFYVINRADGNLYKFVEGSPSSWILAAGLGDAPSDGTRYIRRNAAWEALVGILTVQDTDSPPNVVEDVEVLQVAGGLQLTELAPGVALLETAGVFAEVVDEPGDAVLATGDGFGLYTRFTNASPKTYAFNAGTQTYVSGNEYYGRNVGSGALTIVVAGGMTINAPPGGSLVVPADAEFRVKIISPTAADLMIFGTGTAGETPPQVMSITSSTFGTNTTDHQVDMPATVDNGDLLIVGFSNDGNATVTTPSGWTQLGSGTGGSAVRGSWYYRIADGTEGGTQVNFETSAAENAAAQVHRIKTGTFDPATPPEIQIQPPGTTATAQIVPLIEPSWGYANSLFIASACADDDDGINGWPYPFLQTFTESAATTTSCSIYSAYMQLAIAGMGPLAWATISAEEYVSAHIAVRPSV